MGTQILDSVRTVDDKAMVKKNNFFSKFSYSSAITVFNKTNQALKKHGAMLPYTFNNNSQECNPTK